MSKILRTLKERAASLVEKDFDTWIGDQLAEYYDAKITNLAHYTFRSQGGASPVSLDAFKESAKEELISAGKTFYLKKQHWKKNRDPNPYFRTSLNYLSKRFYWNNKAGQKMTSAICPACKVIGHKEVCEKQDNLLRCFACTKEADRLKDEIKRLEPSSKEYTSLQAKQRFYEMFALHSRKGKKCPDCSRFIPSSILDGLSACPYLDCWYIGSGEELPDGNHPTGVYARPLVSLDKTVQSSDTTLHNFFQSNEVTPDVAMEMRDSFNKELTVLKTVIKDQVNRVKKLGNPSTKTQKLLMYEAFSAMVDKYPEEMISYLVHLKQSADSPIQARIFQEYADLVEDSLPFTVTKYGKEHLILSLTDPNLALFLGVSEYDAEVDENHIIPNLTKEEYIGGRKFKNHGRCFLGKIIDITDNSNNSILNKMKEYSFVQIRMKDSVRPGTKVRVKHFRILPHYEMHSLVYLQRIRRRLVDRIYFRLHKKKRPIQRSASV